MNIKKNILFLVSLSILSCGTQKVTNSSFVSIYKCERVGEIDPSYIILKQQPNIFEIYAPGIYCSVLGEWEILNDTLSLIPKYEYYASDNKMHMKEVTSKDSSIITIPQKYLVSKDKLIDITDYTWILKEFQLNINNIFKRVK